MPTSAYFCKYADVQTDIIFTVLKLPGSEPELVQMLCSSMCYTLFMVYVLRLSTLLDKLHGLNRAFILESEQRAWKFLHLLYSVTVTEEEERKTAASLKKHSLSDRNSWLSLVYHKWKKEGGGFLQGMTLIPLYCGYCHVDTYYGVFHHSNDRVSALHSGLLFACASGFPLPSLRNQDIWSETPVFTTRDQPKLHVNFNMS